MTKDIINKSQQSFEKIKHIAPDGSEYWSARELAKVLEYSDWRNFVKVINKAIEACQNSNVPHCEHFVEATDMSYLGNGASKQIDTFHLSRYACYLIIQNADPTKKIVAAGQTYFAVQTRKQEIAESELSSLNEDKKRILLRKEVTEHNKKLASTAKNAGVVKPVDYAVFQDHGYKGLYGGLGNKDIQEKKGLKKSQSILDHMGSTELAANLFRATQTEEKLRKENIKGKTAANKTHYDVARKIRQTIAEIGGTMPEHLPVADDVKKIERKSKKQLAHNEEI